MGVGVKIHAKIASYKRSTVLPYGHSTHDKNGGSYGSLSDSQQSLTAHNQTFSAHMAGHADAVLLEYANISYL